MFSDTTSDVTVAPKPPWLAHGRNKKARSLPPCAIFKGSRSLVNAFRPPTWEMVTPVSQLYLISVVAEVMSHKLGAQAIRFAAVFCLVYNYHGSSLLNTSLIFVLLSLLIDVTSILLPWLQ